MLKGSFQAAFFLAVVGALSLASAGQLHGRRAWIYLALYAGSIAITAAVVVGHLARHPRYAGVIVGSLAAPLIYGSAWAFVPAAAIAVLFIIRTALEDRALRSELPGYAEYAERTPYRLLPALW